MRHIASRALCALFVFVSSATAQDTERLTVGRTIERELAVRQSHSYTLALDSGRFVFGEAVQNGIDVEVAVVGPSGDTLAKFDSPNGAEGAEPFQFTTKSRGAYRIVVAPFTTATGSGRYALTLRRVEPLAKTPGGKVDQLMASTRANDPGIIAAVVRNGAIVYQKGWGLANLPHNIPFTVDTRTNIGSTSKQFTAFAILLLAEQNKLSLDDDVRKHVPELPDFGETVTIRNLLTHTSGYREFLNTVMMTGRRLDYGDYIDRAEIIEMVKRQPALQNAPGAEFNYNNTAYSLLSTIVERIGGQPFPEWMQANVFKPLGMNNTLIWSTPGQVIPNSAQGYVTVPGGWREGRDLGASMGAGGIYTTLADLARWMRNFKSATVGPPDFFQQMTTRNVLTKGDTTSYGLGLSVDKWRGLQRVQHGGADVAHRSAFQYFPELDAGVIVQSNNAGINSERYAAQLAEIFFEDRITKATTPAVAIKAAFDPAQFDTTMFDAYAGRYELTEAPGFILTFSRRDGRFLIQATGQPEIDITPTSDSTFLIKVVQAVVTFHREADGSVKRLTLNQNGDHPAVRIVTDSAKPDFAQYAGRYYSEELETFYNVGLEGDSLMLRNRRTTPTLLQHQAGDKFSGSGMTITSITFERDGSGKVIAFRAGNGRTRDVVFKKEE